jgi:drug/metabolite transporter (DMT)-like permease
MAGREGAMSSAAPSGPASDIRPDGSPDRPLTAALWMIGAIASFTAMAIAVREIKGVHDTFEIMAIRSVVGFAIVVGVAAAMGRLRDVRADRLGGHLLRNTIHFTGQNLWIWAVTVIPLAQVFALEFTSPVWVLLLSPLLLGERLTRLKILAALIGFAGILIVARPDLSAPNLGVAAAAGSALFFALTNITTKMLTRREGIVSILFWLTVMQFVFGATIAAADGEVSWPTAATMPWLVLIGIAGILAHLCLTSALRLAPASVVMPVDFVRLPVIVVVGATLYDEPVDALVLIGAVVIFAGSYLSIWSQTRRHAA